MGPPTKDVKDQCKASGHDSSDIEGEENEWKFRAPYKIHKKEGDNDDFRALYEGSCHCGRVKYQLSREKPLEAKFCHCATCQVLHGMSMRKLCCALISVSIFHLYILHHCLTLVRLETRNLFSILNLSHMLTRHQHDRRTLPVGCDFRED
jgi:hypothetical protein